MKIDLYSKFLFTVIAVCLVVIVLKDVSFVQEVKAVSNGLTNIQSNYDGVVDVRIVDSKELEVKLSNYLVNTCIKEVNLPYGREFDVNIVNSEKKLAVEIDPNSTVNTCIKKVDPSYSSRSLPVEVTNFRDFPTSKLSQTFQEVDPVEVYVAQNGVRVISTLSVPVSVYTLDGAEVIQTTVAGETLLPLDSGFYVVRAGEYVTKIAVG